MDLGYRAEVTRCVRAGKVVGLAICSSRAVQNRWCSRDWLGMFIRRRKSVRFWPTTDVTHDFGLFSPGTSRNALRIPSDSSM